MQPQPENSLISLENIGIDPREKLPSQPLVRPETIDINYLVTLRQNRSQLDTLGREATSSSEFNIDQPRELVNALDDLSEDILDKAYTKDQVRQKIEKFRSRIDRYRETIRESYEAEQEEAAKKNFQNEGVRKLLLKAFLRHIEVKLINTKAESTATLFHTFITSHENQILRLLNEKIQSNPKSATGLISTNYESPIIDEAAISNHTELFIEVMEELTVKASGFLQKIKSILRGKLGIKPKDKDIKKSLIEFLRSDTGEDRYLENNPQTDEKRFKTRKDHQKLIDIREKIHGKEDLNNLLSDADVTHEFVRAEKFRRKLLAIDSIDETVEQAFASENLEIEAIFYEYIFRQPEVQAVLDTNNAIIQEFLDTLFRKFAAGSLNSALLTMKTEEEDNNSVLLTAFSEAESEDMKEKIRLLRNNIIHIYIIYF